jgi:hypothetical protein
MEPKKAPQPTPDTLIKCRVRPDNRYGRDHGPGSIIELPYRDYLQAKHCLVSLDEEKAEKAAAPTVPTKTELARAEIEGYREANRKALDQMRQTQATKLIRQQQAAEVEVEKLLKKG